MIKKLLSLITATILVFSLIQTVPTYAISIIENNDTRPTNSNNEAQEPIKGGIDSADEKLSDEELENLWARYKAEQEALVTPEIRASIRENVKNSFKSHELTN